MSSPLPGSILVIDDDPNILAAFRRVTRDLPARSRFATSAEEGWELVQAEVPELIISDFRLPGADGLVFLERVHAKHPRVKRILHTAYPVEPVGMGSDIPVLGKPCAADALRVLLISVTTLPSP